MKCLLKLFVIGFLGLNFSCSKDEAEQNIVTKNESDVFVEGKGLRKIWEMKSETKSLGGFYNGHLVYSADGFVNMLFTYGLAGVNGSPSTYTLYRKKINVINGEAVDLPLPKSGLVASSFVEEDGNVMLIPHTNLFAYRYNSSIIGGEASWLPIAGFETVPKIYENQQIVSSYYLPFNNTINATIYTKTYSISQAKVINAPNFCSTIDISTDGVPLIFTAGKSSLQVHNFITNTQLASIPINLFDAYTTFAPQDTKIKTKRSIDGKRIIGLIYESNQKAPKTYTSFIYDIAANTFTLKVNKRQRQSGYLAEAEDFDENGNIFYPTTQGADYQIKRITPTGEEVFKTGFLTTGYILQLKAIGSKVFVVLSSPGNITYSDDRGKGKIILTVAE
jgi:hypothetical protein